MKKLVLGLLALLALGSAPGAQTLPPNTVVGRLGIGPGPAQAIPFPTLTGNLLLAITGDFTCSNIGVCTITTNAVGNSKLAQMPAGTVKCNATAALANAADCTQPVLGLNGGTGGQFGLNGATSGTVTISVPAAAGTTTFRFPGSNGTAGQSLVTDGAGVTSWAVPSNVPFNDITVGAACDYRAVFDGAMGSGSSTLTSATAAFTSADVGKYIAVAGAGAAGVNLFTTVAGFSNATTITLTSGNASGGAISGKVVELGTDDTTVLNANIAAAYAARQNGVIPGKACLVSRLNLTNMQGFTLSGAGINRAASGAALWAKNDASYGGTAGHLIDMSGSLYITLTNIQIGGFYALPRPTTGIFMGQVGTNVSNHNTIGPFVYISGQFANSTFYNYGVPSSTCNNSDFYNYAAGAGTQDAMRFTATNSGAMTSAFVTITSGSRSTSDWTFLNCEWHKFAGAGASNDVIQLDATTNLNFNGGVVSGGAVQYVSFANTVTHTTFANVTFETESEPQIPVNAFFLNAASSVQGLNWTQSSFIMSANLVGGTGTITTFRNGTPYLANSAGALVPGTSLTYFFGTGVNDTVASTNAQSMTTSPSVFANMRCTASGSAGAAHTYTETFMIGGAAVAPTCAMANPAITCSDTAHYAEATAANTGVNFRHVADAAGANTTRMACSIEMQPY